MKVISIMNPNRKALRHHSDIFSFDRIVIAILSVLMLLTLQLIKVQSKGSEGGKISLTASLNEQRRMVLPSLTPAKGYRQSSPTIIVNSLQDTPRGCPQNCSLRRAIAVAQDGDIIGFDADLTGTIEITQPLIIERDVTIIGPGAGKIILDGKNQSQILNIKTGVVEITGLTFRNGLAKYADASDSAALRVEIGNVILSHMAFEDNDGYAIVNLQGKVSVIMSTLSGNHGDLLGGAIRNLGSMVISSSSFQNNSAEDGGAIYNCGNLIIVHSTFVANSATRYGGAIANDNSCYRLTITTVINSTFWNNDAVGGGAIENSGTLSLINTTISHNSAQDEGGGILAHDYGSVKSELLSSIIAGNQANSGTDLSGQVDSLGNNLVGNTIGSSGWYSSDLQNVDPMMTSLADNGGQTQTLSLNGSSPAIGKGYCGGDAVIGILPVLVDQRGAPRKIPCDIGAYESGVEAPTLAFVPMYEPPPLTRLELESEIIPVGERVRLLLSTANKNTTAQQIAKSFDTPYCIGATFAFEGHTGQNIAVSISPITENWEGWFEIMSENEIQDFLENGGTLNLNTRLTEKQLTSTGIYYVFATNPDCVDGEFWMYIEAN